MADQPRRGDDDESTPPSEVTVPPWLRTGSTPDLPVSSPPAVDESATRTSGAVDDRADPDRPDSSRGAAPNRIRLDAGRRADDPVGDPGDLDSRGQDRDLPDSGGRGSRPADLSSLPLVPQQAVAARAGSAAPDPDAPPTGDAHGAHEARGAHGSRARRIALIAASGVAVLAGSAVLGFVITRGAVTPAGEQGDHCAAVSEPGRVVGDGPGSLDSPLETVLAFDHAYYVERSAAQAFEAVSPSSQITEDQLRTDGVDRVPEGTAHCVEARELSPTLLEVTLTESPPDADPVVIRQRVRVAENPDGSWGIVSITPAG